MLGGRYFEFLHIVGSKLNFAEKSDKGFGSWSSFTWSLRKSFYLGTLHSLYSRAQPVRYQITESVVLAPTHKGRSNAKEFP